MPVVAANLPATQSSHAVGDPEPGLLDLPLVQFLHVSLKSPTSWANMYRPTGQSVQAALAWLSATWYRPAWHARQTPSPEYLPLAQLLWTHEARVSVAGDFPPGHVLQLLPGALL